MSVLVTVVKPTTYEVMVVTEREVIVILRDKQCEETWLRIPMEMARALARTLTDAGMAADRMHATGQP